MFWFRIVELALSFSLSLSLLKLKFCPVTLLVEEFNADSRGRLSL